MNLEELQAIRDTERSKDSLQSLDASFYAEVAEYLAELRAERDGLAADVSDPFGDPAIRRLSDEIETGERTVEAIYERRVGKLVKLASFAAAGIPTDEEGLTVEEKALFDNVVEQIEANRQRILDSLVDPDGAESDAEPADPATDVGAGMDEAISAPASQGGDKSPVSSAAADAVTETDDFSRSTGATADSETVEASGGTDRTDDEVVATDAIEGRANDGMMNDGMANDHVTDEAEPTAEAATESPGPERTTVRITRDVGEILGIDERAYDLSTDDVVTLPTENAKPLVQRDAAEPLE